MKKAVRSILHSLGVAILVVDGQREVVYVNSSGMTLFPKAKPGKKISKILRSEKCLDAIKTVLKTKNSMQLTVTLQIVVPTSYRVTISAFESETSDTQAILSFEDVSHIKDAQRMREDFVANVSHELRSPLTALYGFIETLRGPAKGDLETTDRFLARMQDESERMARLIDDLLSLSQLQVSERVVPTDLVNIKNVVVRVVERLEMVSTKAKTEIKLEIPDDLPVVRGEADELTQVFQNLIENAIKYSPANTKVRVKANAVKEDDKFLCIKVVDNGEGIDPKHIPRLTERFYRVDKGRSRAKGGTGLGLAIVKHILIRHRGWLKIKSKPNNGSTFSVNLPIAR